MREQIKNFIKRIIKHRALLFILFLSIFSAILKILMIEHCIRVLKFTKEQQIHLMMFDF